MNPPPLLVVILRLVWIYAGWCAFSFCFSCFSCFFKRDLCSAIFWLCRMLVCMSFVSTVLTIVLLFFLCPRWCSETSCALQWFLAVCCVFPPLFCSIVVTLLLFLLQAFYVQHFSRDNFWCCDALFVCSAPFFLWLFTKISLPCIARCWFSPLCLFWLFFCLACWVIYVLPVPSAIVRVPKHDHPRPSVDYSVPTRFPLFQYTHPRILIAMQLSQVILSYLMELPGTDLPGGVTWGILSYLGVLPGCCTR